MAPAQHWQLGAPRNSDWNGDKHHPANYFPSLVVHRACGKAPTFLVQPPVECVAFLPLWFLHKGFCMQGKLEIQKASVPSQPGCLATQWGTGWEHRLTLLQPNVPVKLGCSMSLLSLWSSKLVSESAWFFINFIKINKGLVAFRSY